MATWFGSDAATTFDDRGNFENAAWGPPVVITSLAASMAVNTLVTGLIVFKILKVFSEINKASSVERSLSSLSSIGGVTKTKLRHIIFLIIESGIMTLFVFQLIHIVLVNVGQSKQQQTVVNFISPINQMFNGITPTIILVRVSMNLSFDDKESLQKTTESLLDHWHASTSDSNTIRRMEDSSNMLPQERSENTY